MKSKVSNCVFTIGQPLRVLYIRTMRPSKLMAALRMVPSFVVDIILIVVTAVFYSRFT